MKKLVFMGILAIIVIIISNIWYFEFFIPLKNKNLVKNSISEKIIKSKSTSYNYSKKYYVETIEHNGNVYTVFITRHKSNIFVIKE